MELDISGEVAIVTGAGRNIGRSIAILFASEGAKVVVVDIDEERANETVGIIKDDGGTARAQAIDVADEDQVRAMVEYTEDTFGPANILVNNAAVKENSEFLEMSASAFDRTVEVNLRGTFLCTREVSKSMKNSDRGSIINFSSTSGHRGEKYSVAYATTKAGILNFTRSVAKVLADDGIRVNTITPTRTGKTTLSDSNLDVGSKHSGDLADDQIRNMIPLGRLGTPDDIAKATLYLASPMSQFITGAEIQVNGGRLA
ncbi:SDR family NAD(P)-dependent oxidoreductase [Halopenitus persicus]|uniref:SDR family NAD(P)-dependent oxidoreductase n=1 Tax=Halopenitus persicus TaxID=1048396 RepID=UPI000BBA7819|nr:SDR family NAD(P)-dependent oxidoreductase [Halopenitus persicus]